MPTKRTRRTRGRRETTSEVAWYFMNDALDQLHEIEFSHYDLLKLKYSCYPHKELADIWASNRQIILKNWIINKPGTRPHCWWLLDAPNNENEGHLYIDIKKQPRKKLGGDGTPSYEAYGIVPSFKHGIPTSWLDSSMQKYCNETKNGEFKGVALNPDNPPIFESQASYLDRFGLLSVAEKRKSDFSNEVIYG